MDLGEFFYSKKHVSFRDEAASRSRDRADNTWLDYTHYQQEEALIILKTNKNKTKKGIFFQQDQFPYQFPFQGIYAIVAILWEVFKSV